jgi:hypothetical protein
MKKYTNKILLITAAIILIVNVVFVSIATQKYKNGTLYEWFGNISVQEKCSSNGIIYQENPTDTVSQIIINESVNDESDTTIEKVMINIR